MFKGLDINELFKKAEEMRDVLAEKKRKAAEETVDIGVGGGMVRIIMNGDMEVLSFKIDPEVVNKDEIEILEDLSRAAVNEAIRKAKELVSDSLGDLMSGVDMPDLSKFVK